MSDDFNNAVRILLGRPTAASDGPMRELETGPLIGALLTSDEFFTKVLTPLSQGGATPHADDNLPPEDRSWIERSLPLSARARAALGTASSVRSALGVVLSDQKLHTWLKLSGHAGDRIDRLAKASERLGAATPFTSSVKQVTEAASLLDPAPAVSKPHSPKRTRNLPPPERNLIVNADLKLWPDGIYRDGIGDTLDFAKGWHLDLARAGEARVSVCTTEVRDVGSVDPVYGARIDTRSLREGGAVRLVATLDPDGIDADSYFFGCSLRPSPASLHSGLTVRSLFLGVLVDGEVRKVRDMRARLALKGTLRLRNYMLTFDEATAELLTSSGTPAIVFDIAGAGEFVVFEPQFARARSVDGRQSDAEGEFEDPNVRDQVNKLRLSTLWQPAPYGRITRAVTRSGASSLTPFVQIVIPVFNAAADVEDCVRSILEHTGSPFEILLSDDGSDDYTVQRLRDLAASDPRVKVHINPENIGYTRNINLALQNTVADYVALVNSDILATPGWLDRLFAALSHTTDTAAAGPLSNAASWQSVPAVKSRSDWAINPLLSGVSANDMAALVAKLSQHAYPEFPLLNGFCTLFRREALDIAGWFSDEMFPSGYGEENDLCLRLGKLGYKLRVADDAYVYHKKSRSFGNDRRKELSKKSNAVLRELHPTVDFNRLEDRMQASSPLNTLRTALAEALHIELEDEGDTA